jgi:hypothetical protein
VPGATAGSCAGRSGARARELLAGHELASVTEADLRDTSAVLDAAGRLLDFAQPVGLLLVACLHNIPSRERVGGTGAPRPSRQAPYRG